ncbi:MAG TPA: cytochrome c [Bacteroidia bacterium]|nr:cytochrome c [Bacteroidia bacterium]
MKQLLSITAIFLFTLVGFLAQAQNSGENLFKVCAACHTIGKGRLVGPDLTRVYEKRDQDWLIKFIRSSQKMVKEGDQVAVSLYKEYNQIPMPDNNLSDDEIISIIDFIKATDTKESGTATTKTTTDEIKTDTLVTASVVFSTDLIKRGKALFYGYEKFSNGAPSCIACHNIMDESLIGGGKLSFDLTKSYSKLSAAGIGAILANPPFPVMNKALNNKKLIEEEIQAITALLQFTDQRNTESSQTSDNNLIFLLLSFVVAMLLMVHIYIMYANRKIPSNN